jgi:hypothetical protein
MSAKQKAPNVKVTVLDGSVPLPLRRQLLMQLCLDESKDTTAVLESILQDAAARNGEDLYAKKLKEVTDLLQQMEAGPLRYGWFERLLPKKGTVQRAKVMLPDGSPAYTAVPDPNLAAALCCGEVVLLEAQGKALLDRDPAGTDTGEEGRLERRLDPERIEVTLRDHERLVLRASAALRRKLDDGEVVPGGTLLVGSRVGLAFDAVPNPDGLSHYRYLVKDPPPDVLVERDIGAPPGYIATLTEHVRAEMLTPELGRKYRLRRSAMVLLTGVSGSGKTLSIMGFWRQLYEVVSEITGVPMTDLPPRVIRLRTAELLSKWLGESDKQIDRAFDEVEQLADETFTAPEGETYELPVLVILEECDGLARARGDDAIYDRIQTTLLQRLDTTSQKLKDRLIIFLFTTNVAHVVDPAFLRRAGGMTEHFGRLNRRSFLAVLAKHLRGLPFQGDGGADQGELERQVTADLTGWLFSPNGPDRGQVELTYHGSTQPVVKFRRDFLTAGLVDRAVQQAATAARRAERLGCDRPGLTSALLIGAFDKQVRAVVEQLHERNVANYLDLPDGVRVANLRRLDQPAILPFELERAS